MFHSPHRTFMHNVNEGKNSYIITASDFLSFVYDLELFDVNDLTKGLMRGHLLLKVSLWLAWDFLILSLVDVPSYLHKPLICTVWPPKCNKTMHHPPPWFEGSDWTKYSICSGSGMFKFYIWHMLIFQSLFCSFFGGEMEPERWQLWFSEVFRDDC